jgi:hypothetical protein
MTATAELRRTLTGVPDVEPEPIPEVLVESSVRYLGSDAARRSLAADSYWPKWDSPWWHMLLLHELGEARRIPAPIVAQMVDALNALPIKVFPIHPSDVPPGSDPYRDSTCHCALGCMHAVLTACGVDVAAALPWVEPWFPRYQMPDGGANCDSSAYLVAECASSMVGTIATFEAMLGTTSDFVERAAAFLIARRLMDGSPSQHNAEEREAAPAWLLPCFPRFYFYDVLRGLAALVRWAEVTEQAIPHGAVAITVEGLVERWPDGVVRVERHAHAGRTTLLPTADRSPCPRAPVSTFPLLEAAGVIGEPSEGLTRQWSRTRAGLLRLARAGRLVE